MLRHDDLVRLRRAIREPLRDLAYEERARLHASLGQAEVEIAAGKGVSAADLLQELRAAK
jgi:hypothetical protein